MTSFIIHMTLGRYSCTVYNRWWYLAIVDVFLVNDEFPLHLRHADRSPDSRVDNHIATGWQKKSSCPSFIHCPHILLTLFNWIRTVRCRVMPTYIHRSADSADLGRRPFFEVRSDYIFPPECEIGQKWRDEKRPIEPEGGKGIFILRGWKTRFSLITYYILD